MALGNYVDCKRCGKIFLKLGTRTTCTECAELEEKEFQVVKDYLYKYPNSSIDEVAEQTEVDVELISDWIRTGRLETKGVTITYPCSICGRPIHIGTICSRCQGAIGDAKASLTSSIEEKEKVDNRRVFTSENTIRKERK